MTSLSDFTAHPSFTSHLRSTVLAIGQAGTSLALRLRGAFQAPKELNEVNVQGEKVQEFDRIADELFCSVIRDIGTCRSIVSEERPDEVLANPEGHFLIAIDPLDGSSIPVGTIFGIYASAGKGWGDSLNQPLSIICGGFFSYGIVPVLYLAFNDILSQFKLDWETCTWQLTESKLQMPPTFGIFSCNDSNLTNWTPKVQNHLQELKKDAKSCRYSGSLVADMEKILLKGGVFAYPADRKSPHGKLRLLYECLPMSLVAACAGGSSSNGSMSVLEIIPSTIHERVAFFVGNSSLVSHMT